MKKDTIVSIMMKMSFILILFIGVAAHYFLWVASVAFFLFPIAIFVHLCITRCEYGLLEISAIVGSLSASVLMASFIFSFKKWMKRALYYPFQTNWIDYVPWKKIMVVSCTLLCIGILGVVTATEKGWTYL